MLTLKKYLKSIGISYAILLLLTMFFTILNYFNIIGLNILNYIFYIIPFVSFLVGGFFLGKASLKKGWLVGIYFSLISIVLLFFVNLILFNEFIMANIFNYLIISLGCMLGCIFGINKKKS